MRRRRRLYTTLQANCTKGDRLRLQKSVHLPIQTKNLGFELLTTGGRLWVGEPFPKRVLLPHPRLKK